MTTRLWWVRPETFPSSPEALAWLDPEERSQQLRFLPPLKRHEYLVTRALVRTVLGEALGLAPAAVRFVRNQWGRPELSPPAPLHFNISHTEGLVVCLVSTDCEVGVDTELISRAPRVLALAPNVFAPRELADLSALPPEAHAERALLLWTLKESYIKARGMGLALALESFAFHFDQGVIRLEVEPTLHDVGSRWQFETRRLGPHLVSTALACPPEQAVAIEYLEWFPKALL